MDDIDGKSTEKQPELFNQSYKAIITPLLIYGLHTHTHTHANTRALEVISRNQARAWFKNAIAK